MSYSIKVLVKEISVRNPILKFDIKPKPKVKPSVKYRDKSLAVLYDEDRDIYQVELIEFKSGEYSLDIEIGEWRGKINFEIKGGFKEKDII